MTSVRVLLICAGGMSTSILMKKLEKYAVDNGVDLTIRAVGVGEFVDVCADFDVMLLGPQIMYQRDNVAQKSGKPTAVIPPQDYGIGNAPAIFKLIEGLLG